jgi:hypothetical protein
MSLSHSEPSTLIQRTDAVMSLSLQEERRRTGDSQSSNFVEIFQGTNLVSSDPLKALLLIKQRRFFISAAIPLFAQLSGNSVSR